MPWSRILPSPGRLRPIDPPAVERALAPLRAEGIDVLAVCLLHAYLDPSHEREVADVAKRVGFRRVYLSSDSARRIKMVARGDTTVADAYLTPVLDDYLARIERALSSASTFRLLTSAGGLATPRKFSGKESVLSGPAGGVVGVAQVASEHAHDRVIGFDMGGTSTDVSRFDGRFDGRFEMQYEGERAGVRLVTPMLAIETVAAGGGSICAFGREMRARGPESAESIPGPACYGSGATPNRAGASAVHTHMTNTRITDPEVLESRYPVRLVEFAIRRGSGGRGRNRGGDGVVREIEFLDEVEVSLITQRRTRAPYGVAGGEPGATGRNWIMRAGREREALDGVAMFRAERGDRIRIETPGGGAWGPPPAPISLELGLPAACLPAGRAGRSDEGCLDGLLASR